MDAGVAAIVGAGVGAIGGAGASVVAHVLSARDRRRDRQLAIVEDALNRVTREQRLLQVGYSHWKRGVPLNDERVGENADQLIDAIEEIWVAEDLMRINFGQRSSAVAAFDAVVDSTEELKDALTGRGPIMTEPEAEDWRKKQKALIDAKKEYIEAVRQAIGLEKLDVLGVRTSQQPAGITAP